MLRSLLVSALAAVVAGLPSPSTGAGQPKGPGPDRPGAVRHFHEIDTGAAPYPRGTRAYAMTYQTTAPDGGRDLSSGLLLLPAGPVPPGGWPVVAWDHGTTGIGDDCEPSSMEGAAYGHLLGQFLRHGYAVTATDYPGLGTSGVHPFLVAESEARATVDAVRAAHQISGRLSKKWFAVGYSQGGQAALASAELADDYDGRLEFQGATAFAPAPNMSGWAADIASANLVEQEFYAMMLVGLRTQHRGLRWADYLGPDARSLLPAVRAVCFDELTSVFAAAQLPASEFEPRDAAATERLFHWFLANEVGHQRADGPLLVIQGSADVIVPEPATREMVSLARSNGSDVEYRVFEGADHAVYTDGESALFAWLAGSLAARDSGGAS